MNVFEFAMQMEKDGEAFYRKMADNSGNNVVKNVLLDLADDEVKHYNIFKRFRDGDLSVAVGASGPRKPNQKGEKPRQGDLF